MELTPTNLRERTKWKVSSANLVPLSHHIHRHLTDGKSRKAIVRPTRADLLQLVHVLEDALARQSAESSQGAWQPRWEQLLQHLWPRKETIGTVCLPSYEYQIDFFELKSNTIMNCKAPRSFRKLEEASGDRTYPNTMEHGLEKFKAPLSILSVVAVAVSQMWFVSRQPGRRYQPDFLEDLEVMSYVVNVLGSPDLTSFRSFMRPSVLPPLPLLSEAASFVPRPRHWPVVSATPSAAPGAALPEFSSSPPHGFRETLAPDLYGMESDQTPEEVGPTEASGQSGDESGGSGGGNSSEPGDKSDSALEDSLSSGLSSSMGTSGLSRGTVDTFGDSQMGEAESHAIAPSLRVGTKTVDAAQHHETRPVEASENQHVDSFEVQWHEEWQSLEAEQDLVLGTASLALVQQFQASCTEAHTATSAGPFDFLVDQQPLEITPKLQSIDQRREEMLEQWDEVLERRQRRQWLERHGLTEIE